MRQTMAGEGSVSMSATGLITTFENEFPALVWVMANWPLLLATT